MITAPRNSVFLFTNKFNLIICQVRIFNMQTMVVFITINAILVLTNSLIVALRDYQNFYVVFNTKKEKRYKIKKKFIVLQKFKI